jgi:hypothetical protein
MVKDSTFGHKGNNMRVLTKTTWSKDLVLINGKMEQDILESGWLTNVTAKAT